METSVGDPFLLVTVLNGMNTMDQPLMYKKKLNMPFMYFNVWRMFGTWVQVKVSNYISRRPV